MNIIKLQGHQEKVKGIFYEYDMESKPLGEGGMGRVFKGFRVVERTGERTPVAIKAIYENIPERVVERARREAEIQLESDNLIRMYGFIEHESFDEQTHRLHKHYHVVMELLVGVTLEDLMNGITNDHSGLQIPFASELHSQYVNNRDAAVISIMKSVLSGLMILHDKGYIHRDIDPSNIMITIDRKVKLIDFGICKQIVSLESQDKSLTAAGVFMGKVNYAAPELVLGDVRSQSYTTDIYAMGILLYQMCAGHLPFSGTDQDILAANLRQKLPMKDIHRREFRKVIAKATDKVQGKRYASAAEFRVDLERISPVGQNSTLGKTRIPVIAGVTGVAVGVIAAVIILFNGHNGSKTEDTTVHVPDSAELCDSAMSLIMADSLNAGHEILQMLVRDSSYFPAMTKLINSNVKESALIAYEALSQLALAGDCRAMYECGVTLSAPSQIEVSQNRQELLGIESDLVQANEWLEKCIAADQNDYKSVYWLLHNLIIYTYKNNVEADRRLPELYKLFVERSNAYDDKVAETYRNAIKSDEKTLRNWGLI